MRDDSQGEACPTDSGFIADQDRATIAKSSTLPRDSGPRVTSPAAEEGSMQQTINELTAFCTSLQRQHSELLAKFQAQEVEIIRLKERVQVLEDKDGFAQVWKWIEDFTPMGLKEEAERATRKRIILEKEQVKKQKSSKEAPESKTPNEEVTLNYFKL
nr:hypothetical protein [Tanacetum cinerariifolium]